MSTPLTGGGPWTAEQLCAAYPGTKPEDFVDNNTAANCKARFAHLFDFKVPPFFPGRPSVFDDERPFGFYEPPARDTDDGDQDTRL